MSLKKLLFSTLILPFTLLGVDTPAAAGATAAPATTQKNALDDDVNTLYTFPGFVFQRDGGWVGSDYLYNLQNDIGLYVEVLYPENESVEVNSQKLSDLAVNIFRKNKLVPRLNPSPGVSALPFFYVQIMIFPTDQGNVSLVTGSLFESISLTRIPIQKDTAIQGITWEKKTMFMSTKDNFDADLTKTVEEITTTFGERWRLFDNMKSKTSSTTAAPTSVSPLLPKATKPKETRK